MTSYPHDDIDHQQVMKECFAQLWEHSADFMFIMAVEPDGEFSLYDNNPASRAMMGLKEEEQYCRLSLRKFWNDEIVEGLYAAYHEAIEARKPVSIEQYVTESGRDLFASTLFVPIFDESGHPAFVCGVSRDISDIKAAEQMALAANIKLQEYSQALENINKNLDDKVKSRTRDLEQTTQELEIALEAKSSFVARMSHEIRTPINAMLGMCSLLHKTPLDHIQQDYVAKILDSGEVLLRLVNDILDFSKIEVNGIQIEQIEFDLESVVCQALNVGDLKSHEKGIEMVLDIDPAVPDKLIGDPTRIQQIVINLIGNALKFTEQGSVSLKIYAESAQLSDQIWLHFEVTDTGIGISKAQQEHLFRAFAQADDSITRRYGGSGLGLFISQRLCQLMGGSISLDSEEGKGSCFHVALPLKIAESSPMSRHFKEGSGHKVLVVDDLELSRKALTGMLDELGYQVETATNGHQALEKIAQAFTSDRPFEAVLLDWKMPGIDGVETSRRIKKLFHTQPPPILMISAYQKQAVLEHLQSGLISRFLEKPVSPSSLFDAVEEILFRIGPVHAPSTVSTPIDLSAYRLLLVEDNLVNQQVAQGYLDDCGIEVLIANDGEEAIELLKQQPVDIVLMDIQMPKLDGLSTTRLLRKQMHFRQPIVAMTAHVSDSAIHECLSAGMDAHIGKPVAPSELYQVLAECLHQPLPHPATIAAATKSVANPQSLQIAALSAISGLVVPRALKQLGGRYDLYLSLVETFYQQYAAWLDRGAFGTMADEQLADVAHTLKSNAAYIGAFELSALATEVEKRLQHQLDVDPKPLLLELSVIMKQLAPLFQERQEHGVDHPQILTAADLEILLEQLQQSDFSVEVTLKSLMSRVRHYPDALVRVMQMSQYVNDVEFEKAFEIAIRWKNELP
ncbi:response regulator [Celerinatantimonas sp. YJH-8]|uniref:response regulator n=1 Tax=Celerinatantimonas sp. YJH-8 TaxID=3228714 RepID=UPI0038C91B3F